jgi:hypothetical protein
MNKAKKIEQKLCDARGELSVLQMTIDKALKVARVLGYRRWYLFVLTGFKARAIFQRLC